MDSNRAVLNGAITGGLPENCLANSLFRKLNAVAMQRSLRQVVKQFLESSGLAEGHARADSLN